MPDGAGYAVTADTELARPPQLCTLMPGSGMIAGADVTVEVQCRAGVHSAYVADLSDAVSQYAVGPGGRLAAAAPAAVPAGPGPSDVTVDPLGRHAYVADGTGHALSQFSIADDGTLSPVGNPLAMPDDQVPAAVAIDPSGRHAYVALRSSNEVAQYAVSGDDGSLTPMNPATVATGSSAFAVSTRLAIDPSGRHAYVGSAVDNIVWQFAIGPDGRLSPAATPGVPTGGQFPSSIVIAPSGRTAYVTNAVGGEISQYTVSPVDGHLDPMTPAKVQTASGALAVGMTIEPSGRYAYVALAQPELAGSILAYAIAADGTLQRLPDAASASGFTPSSLAVATSGRYLYAVTETDNSVRQFEIADGGGLVPVEDGTVATEPNPAGIAVR